MSGIEYLCVNEEPRDPDTENPPTLSLIFEQKWWVQVRALLLRKYERFCVFPSRFQMLERLFLSNCVLEVSCSEFDLPNLRILVLKGFRILPKHTGEVY